MLVGECLEELNRFGAMIMDAVRRLLAGPPDDNVLLVPFRERFQVLRVPRVVQRLHELLVARRSVGLGRVLLCGALEGHTPLGSTLAFLAVFFSAHIDLRVARDRLPLTGSRQRHWISGSHSNLAAITEPNVAT